MLKVAYLPTASQNSGGGEPQYILRCSEVKGKQTQNLEIGPKARKNRTNDMPGQGVARARHEPTPKVQPNVYAAHR